MVLFGTVSVLRKREREGKRKREGKRREMPSSAVRCGSVMFGAVRGCPVLFGAVRGLLDTVRCCPVPFGAERERGSERQRGAGDPSEAVGARESDEAARGGRRG